MLTWGKSLVVTATAQGTNTTCCTSTKMVTLKMKRARIFKEIVKSSVLISDTKENLSVAVGVVPGAELKDMT